jgi:pSer/pThr/pTyr-binding forkhead associated (FHA) protein
VIILNLLNSIPPQTWSFESEQIIRIGRATDNNVVLFSAVVSRHHAELRSIDGKAWDLVNLSSNGTYVEGEPIKKVAVSSGIVFRLATSGPKIEITLADDPE